MQYEIEQKTDEHNNSYIDVTATATKDGEKEPEFIADMLYEMESDVIFRYNDKTGDLMRDI